MVKRHASSWVRNVVSCVQTALLTGLLLVLTTQQVCITKRMLHLKPYRDVDDLLLIFLFFFYIFVNIIVGRILWRFICILCRSQRKMILDTSNVLLYNIGLYEPKRTRSGKIYGYRRVV